MPYKHLTKKTTTEYLKINTNIFNMDDTLSIYEIGGGEDDGDGFVNHLFRVTNQNGYAVIVKQALPYLKTVGEGFPLTVDRNEIEANTLRIREAFASEYVPKLLFLDVDNYIFVMEDCGHLKIMRFELIKMKEFPKFSKQMGEFLGKSHFYTSDWYLDSIVKKELGAHFVNPEMRRVMETLMFLSGNDNFETDPKMLENKPHVKMADLFWEDNKVSLELLLLRDIYMQKSQCLVHSDIHTSNVMIDENEMKIIDQEYTFMGPAAYDLGYLIGNFIYQYISWEYRTNQGTSEQRSKYQEYLLSTIQNTITEYFTVLSECFENDAKEIYKRQDYLEAVLLDILQDSMGFAAGMMMGRVTRLAPLPEFDIINNIANRNNARRLALTIAKVMLLNRKSVFTVKGWTDLIINTADQYKFGLEVAKAIEKNK